MTRHASRLLAIGALVLAACGGDDDGGGATKPAGGAAGQAKPGAGSDNKTRLQPRLHAEERVVQCPIPDKPDGAKCDPSAPTCDPGYYCLQVWQAGTFCEPCPERDAIRHEFRDRDFAAEQNRDPFQSWVVVQPGLGSGERPIEKTQDCKREDQIVAPTYSYTELRLVGVVAQGTQHKALMMDPGNKGNIVKRGDCIGKEKAVVKDIAAGADPYVALVIHPDQSARNQTRPDEEKSIPLHPTGLNVAPPPGAQQSAPGGSGTPIVAPPVERTKPAPPPAPTPNQPPRGAKAPAGTAPAKPVVPQPKP